MDWFNNCFAEVPQLVNAFVQRVTTFVSTLWDDQNGKTEADVVINVPQTDAGVPAATSLLSAQTTGSSDLENPRSLSPANQDVVINVMSGAVRHQTDVGVSHTTSIGAQAISSFNIESSRSSSPFEVMSNGNAREVRDQIVFDMSDVTASLLPQIPIAAQATSSSQIQNSRNLTREVASNSNALVIDQTNVDTSDRASLLHQTPFETRSFHIGRDLLPEGQHTSLGVANDDSAGLSSPPAQAAQRQSPPDAVTHSGAQIPSLKNELKVGASVSMISAGGVVSMLSGLVGNETASLTHKILFQAFTVLNYVSFVLGVGVILLTLTHPNIPGLVAIVKVTMWTALGSVTYAVDCAACLLLPELVEVILALVAPLVMFCLVVILRFCCKN